MTHVIPAIGSDSASAPKSCSSCKWLRVRADSDQCLSLSNKPVGLKIMTADQVRGAREFVGSGCGSYNSSTRAKAMPDSEVPIGFPLNDVDEESVSNYQRAQVQSCGDCRHYVEPEVAERLGFPSGVGMCLAKGTMIQGDRYRIAQDCNLRSRDNSIINSEVIASMMVLFPEYNPAHIDKWMELNNKKRSNKCLPDGFDPATYVGQPVIESMRQQGVRAWLEVNDPQQTGNTVGIPIFDPAYFSPEERAKIPTSASRERPDLYVDHAGVLYDLAVAFMGLDETPALWGLPGVGKTELARYLAWVMQLPFERISITDTTELDDLQGSMRFEKNETRFQAGRVTQAWAKPCVLLIDEPNVGPRAVWQFLRPLTDNSKQLVVDADNGKVIPRDDNCYLMFAMNPAWDIRNDGTNTLADADIRRLYHIEMSLPSEAVERKIITDHCRMDGFEIPEKLLDLVINIGNGIRGHTVDSLPVTWGIASQIKAARYLNWFAPLVAYRRAVADSLEPEVRDLILNEVRTRFSGRL